MRIGSRGDALRLRISNELGTAPLRVEDLRVGVKNGKAAPLPVTVGGRAVIEVPVGAALLSDPVRMPVAALQEISVSAYFPQPTRPPCAAPSCGSQMAGRQPSPTACG